MLRRNPHASISAPTASATLSTAGSTVMACCCRRGRRACSAPGRGWSPEPYLRSLRGGGGGGRDAERGMLLAPALDDLDDLALRQPAGRPDRDAGGPPGGLSQREIIEIIE